jgi:hypothetical protein
VPPLQLLHAALPLALLLYLPASHTAHSDVLLLYLPAKHPLQAARPPDVAT